MWYKHKLPSCFSQIHVYDHRKCLKNNKDSLDTYPLKNVSSSKKT